MRKPISPSSGNVGIGTTTPGSKLNIVTSGTELTGTANSTTFRLAAGAIGDNSGDEVSLGSFGFKGSISNNISLGISGYRVNAGNTYGNTAIILGFNVDNSIREGGYLTLRQGGNVGIGTINPQDQLHILKTNDHQLAIDATGQFSSIDFDNAGLQKAQLYWDNVSLNFNIQSGISAPLLLNPLGGNVAVGASDSHGYKFAVNGNAIATSMTVKLYSDWPDYVFRSTYKLPSLLEVKTYIDQNQHLPEMPSEQEIKDNGINLGEIVKVQTKKIEELTLYLIEKDKQIQDQQNVNTNLQSQINELAKKLNK